MAEHVWSVLCEDSIVDGESHLITLLNCVGRLTIWETEETRAQGLEGGQTPLFSVRLQLASRWVRSDASVPEDRRGRVVLFTPVSSRNSEPLFSGNSDPLGEGTERD
jgi:hypothetical protein